ncbi:MAG TPA: hypothetical protein EYG18_10030 [Micavibrio sp.]|jgi:hypothetical protein|nr:hypothetical protein [Micavibrio sp.]HIL29595.1 hypothetical protein [Micavibrio sp.]
MPKYIIVEITQTEEFSYNDDDVANSWVSHSDSQTVAKAILKDGIKGIKNSGMKKDIQKYSNGISSAFCNAPYRNVVLTIEKLANIFECFLITGAKVSSSKMTKCAV